MKKFWIAILTVAAAFSAAAQTKTVTNDDLEKFREQRVESERKLKERYAEMGFPSPAQLEKQNAAQRAELEEYSDQLRRQRLWSQNDIIAQANALRAQIVSINAQIGYLRRGQGGGSYSSGVVLSSGYAPFGYPAYGNRGGYRGGGSVLSQVRNLPPNMRTVQEYALMYPNSPGLFNQRTGNVRVNPGIGGGYGRRGSYRGGFVAPFVVGGSYNSNDLNQQLIYLEQTRAGLLAQWNVLAEQARRTGLRLD